MSKGKKKASKRVHVNKFAKDSKADRRAIELDRIPKPKPVPVEPVTPPKSTYYPSYSERSGLGGPPRSSSFLDYFIPPQVYFIGRDTPEFNLDNSHQELFI